MLVKEYLSGIDEMIVQCLFAAVSPLKQKLANQIIPLLSLIPLFLYPSTLVIIKIHYLAVSEGTIDLGLLGLGRR